MKWQITPLTTFTMVLLALSPCLIKAWRDPRPGMITRWVAYAYTCGFLFGWHVHEKASLHFVIPLATVAVQNLDNARHYFLLSIGKLLPACAISLQATRGYLWDLVDAAVLFQCLLSAVPFLFLILEIVFSLKFGCALLFGFTYFSEQA